MRLRYQADLRSLAFLGLYFLLFGSAWFGFLPENSLFDWAFWNRPSPSLPWYFWAFWLPLLCILNFMVAITIHNTVHCPVFVGKNWNRVHQILLTLAFGAPAAGYVPGHNLSHHKHLQTAKDNTRTTKMRFRWNFLNQALFFFVMIPGIIRTENRFLVQVGPSKPNWYKQYKMEWVLAWVWKLFFFYWNWKLALVVLLIPNIYAVWGIFGTNFWQHDGCDPNHPYNHSRNFTGTWFNFLVCNNGYHGAHHMKPGLHWSLYPAYHQEHIAPHLHPALDQKSLLKYLWTALIWPGKRINYLGDPIQPGPLEKDEDWVEETKEKSMAAEDMGGWA